MATVRTKEQFSDENERLRDEIEKKQGKTPEQLYDERERRIRDAIQLREPDRVPVGLSIGNFVSRHTGINNAAAFYDQVAWREAARKVFLDFEPDFYKGGDVGQSGAALEALDPKHERWSGYNLPPDGDRQVIETELMKEEEYDLFLHDPTDF